MKKTLLILIVLVFVALFMTASGCDGTAGHKGLETGTGYSDVDSTDLGTMIDYWESQAEEESK
jgi:hypothetical protein